jgi:hypothetical protein
MRRMVGLGGQGSVDIHLGADLGEGCRMVADTWESALLLLLECIRGARVWGDRILLGSRLALMVLLNGRIG